MSAFEVRVTPTRLKNKARVEAREPTEVIMAPFSGKSIVLFEDVPVTKTAKRILRIINPSDEDIEVSVSRNIDPEHNLTLEWLENTVPAQNLITMELVWTPQIDVACKETLQFTDNRNFRKDVMVILKSKANKPPKNVRKYPTISSGAKTQVTTSLRLKSPTSGTNKTAAKLNHQQQQAQLQKKRLMAAEYGRQQQKQLKQQAALKKEATAVNNGIKSNGSSNAAATNCQSTAKSNAASMHNTSPLMERNIYGAVTEKPTISHISPHLLHVEECNVNLKENVSPLSNVLNMIDDLKFTPAAVNTAAAYHQSQSRFQNLSQLPTPLPNAAVSIIITEAATRELKPRCLSSELLGGEADEGQRQSAPSSNEDLHNDTKGTTLPSNKTFDIKQCESLESSAENLNASHGDIVSSTPTMTLLPLNKTAIMNTPAARALEIIQEEENTSYSSLSINAVEPKTLFSADTVDENLKRDIKLVGTPLRKYSESMKDLYGKSPNSNKLAQGSLPNLNEMETIKSIEQNRYFQQSSSRRDISEAKSYKNLHIESQKSPNQKSCSELLNSSQASLSSHADDFFNQNEILAQSSRFNLNEIGTGRYRKVSPSINKTKSLSSLSSGSKKSEPTPPKSSGQRKLSIVNESCCSSNPYKRRNNELSFSDSSPSMDSIFSASSSTMSDKTTASSGKSSTVSPPKKQRLDLDSSLQRNTPTNASQMTSRYAKAWAQAALAHPKKFKLCKTTALLKKPLTPKRLKEEPRIKLYDSELYLQPYINPDPFAATTTCDPFLASTMYLDEAAVDKHIIDFRKWLNALVTVPADLNTDSNAKIDVGKLFNEVRHKDLILAPTKEQQSISYLTNFRLESLRRAAVQLFLSEEMRAPCSKVAVYVQKNALRIRKDRNLHLDVVTQREILELLLCFNPLWLRLGLEVVYGEKIHLQSNSDIVGLSTFILNRLFRDRFLEQKYSRAYTLSDEYAEHIKKFTLQKFFFLLLFLDRAKDKRIIAHNPCLFVKKSPHKETREVLLRFSSELLANIGDITRDLKRLGYQLSHKQTYLDEFDYAFNRLEVDLRDGIRLTRVMEIILLRDDLTKQLRVPAISRLQRIFNVNLGLKALGEADFQLKGDISASDIVDGHREKTLSLLWQIIYKFRSPKFHAAARVIQRWWHNSWLRVVIQRRIRHKEEMRRQAAAIVIQSAYRGLIERRNAKIFKLKRTMAAVVLQKCTRRFLARRQFLRTVQSACLLQRWLRACRLARQQRQQYLQLRQSAICLQQHWRSKMLVKSLREQAAFEKSAYQQERHKAATCIQAAWKGYKAKRKFKTIVHAVLLLQRQYRAQHLMKQARESYLTMRKSVIIVQHRFRANMLMKKQKNQYQATLTSITILQRQYRAQKAMRAERTNYLSIRQKIIAIQQKWRATVLARQQRLQFISMQYYCTVVQQKFRANKQMSIERAYYQKLCVSVITVQRVFRGKLQMRKEREQFQRKMQAIHCIQAHYRAHKQMRYQRAKYQGTRAAILCLQEHVRNWLQMKRARHSFLQQKQAAITIQRRFRSNQIMKTFQLQYKQLRHKIILIQRKFRATLEMRKQRAIYLHQRQLIEHVQLKFRAKLLASKQQIIYQQQRSAIIKLQRRFRAHQLMKRVQSEYNSIRTHIITIQTFYRSYLQMKRQRVEYIQQRCSAIRIQSWYRAILQMRREKNHYHRIRSSSLTIQQRWRATREAKLQRQIFLKTIQKVICLQRVVRATLQMRQQRQQFEKQKQAAIIIQRHFRSRRKMLQIRTQYQVIRTLIICIQRKFRANREMFKVRREYQQLRQLTIHLQQKFRGRLRMREQREHFLSLKQNIVIFQANARGLLARRRHQALMTPEMKDLLRQKKAAKIIQRVWRGHRIRRKLRNIRIAEIRKKIKLLGQTSNTVNSIRSKVQDAVRILKGRFVATEALHVLMRLDRISRTVPHLLMCRSEFISTFCYGIMAQAIRSEVDKQVIMYCSRIILNLARYNSTTANTFQEGGLVTIAQMLLRWCDKEGEIFNTLCTLIWIFAHCPVKRKIIHDFMTTTDAIYMVRETKKLVARKEKMKQNVRKPTMHAISSGGSLQRGFGMQQQPNNFSSRALPSLQPDYGVIRNKPYTFISSVYAFDTILYKLGIDIF